MHVILSIQERKDVCISLLVKSRKQDHRGLSLHSLTTNSSSGNVWGATTRRLGFAGRSALEKEKLIFTCGKDLVPGQALNALSIAMGISV